MRRLVFGLGGLQVIITLAAIAAILFAIASTVPRPLSPVQPFRCRRTAIVVQLLSDAKRLGSQTGRTSFRHPAVPGPGRHPAAPARHHSWPQVRWVGAWSAFSRPWPRPGVAIAVIGSSDAMPCAPASVSVAGGQSSDLFMAATLLNRCRPPARLPRWPAFRLSLGAFIAGLLLAETEFRRAIEAIIERLLKGLLLGASFLLVGSTSICLGLFENPLRIVAAAAALILSRVSSFTGLAEVVQGQPHGCHRDGTAVGLAVICFVILGSATA